ncbi:MAG: hypothetical protein AB2392_18020 [Neobacillus sp.]
MKKKLNSLNHELSGEKISFVKWSSDKSEYLRNLFSPVKLLQIEEEHNGIIKIAVPNDSDENLIGKIVPILNS